MDKYFNNHYITTDPEGRITYGWSTGPLPGRDTSSAVLLTDQGGYQFRLTPAERRTRPSTRRTASPSTAGTGSGWSGALRRRSRQTGRRSLRLLPPPRSSCGRTWTSWPRCRGWRYERG